jgi:hypothetical protein
MRDHDHYDPEILQDFQTWCRAHRALLGRDRMLQPFVGGWRAGYESGVRAAELQTADEGSSDDAR